MFKKGFVHLLPLFALAVLVLGSAFLVSVNSETRQKQAVGKVLSEKSEAEKQAEEKSQESVKKEAELQSESVKKASEQNEGSSNKSSSSNSTNSRNKTKVEIEKEKDKVKIKTKNEATGFESETETENGKEKTKVKFKGIKIEIEREGDKLVTKFKDEQGEEVELEASEEAEILDDLNEKLEDDDIEVATESAQPGFIQKGKKVRTNFPLSINPATGELFVTTPSGTKVVTILPQQAIENMINAGVLTRVDETEPTAATPPESSQSAQPISVENASIELTEKDSQPTYIISGIKSQKVLGVIPFDFKIKTYVSATDGSLLDIEQGFLSKILDVISF
ncbi:MAG: hypothetical protein AAB512_05365 [Patescibacteria group bacterium]